PSLFPCYIITLPMLFFFFFLQHLIQLRQILCNLHFQLMQIRHNLLCRWILYRYIFHFFILVNGKVILIVNNILLLYKERLFRPFSLCLLLSISESLNNIWYIIFIDWIPFIIQAESIC